jgi:Glycosyltransferase family 92
VAGAMNKGRREIPYLSICAIYRDEARYLREWIEFHRLVGVERFFLYDNLSADDHREVLAPYVANGTVVVHDWPISYIAQMPCYRNCLDLHREDSRWIAFIDVDEFLFSPTGTPVSEVLRDYEQWPGVGVHWAMFGTSGHRKRPAGLVIENYLYRMDPALPATRPGTWFRERKYVKSIIDPKRTVAPRSGHLFHHTRGHPVDENKQPLEKGFTDAPSYERLRINHYFTKSEQEYDERRHGKTRVAFGVTKEIRAPKKFEHYDRELNQERDDVITMYVPRLREALGMPPAPVVSPQRT